MPTTKTQTDQGVKNDASDMDTRLGDMLDQADEVVSKYIDLTNQQPVFAFSTDILVRESLRAEGNTQPGDLAIENQMRLTQAGFKARGTDDKTKLDRVPLNPVAEDRFNDPLVCHIVFCSLTDEDSIIPRLGAVLGTGDKKSPAKAMALFYSPSIAPQRRRKHDGRMIPDQFAPANYIGVVRTFATAADAEEAREELVAALWTSVRPTTDTALEDDDELNSSLSGTAASRSRSAL